MTDKDLEKANKLTLEIKELESFLFSAEKVWTGKIVKQTSKFILKSSPYGIFNEAEYNMNTEVKNKVLDVLKQRLDDLREQLKAI